MSNSIQYFQSPLDKHLLDKILENTNIFYKYDKMSIQQYQAHRI